MKQVGRKNFNWVSQNKGNKTLEKGFRVEKDDNK